ncbi:GH25 family lysozyme [Heyndrickxia oleronia]|jgi:GH25 family lysozyme M1 (1,4-beta-N-acetylmuramidase)|uniref:GH25 family lysozyme n=1 Tax=Heyndrickxia oleronia TaxID=38875 RepID=UPI0024304B45|nr:GH25 family lysozyme [Heyndrickxia oleronia]MCI1615976.1 N-acetylmuramoyl-L-alanine amidase [Heyndrickxia oleronia]
MGKIVDLSYCQTNVDYAKLAKEVDLAILRVQYGSNKADKEYKNHVAGCKKFGIPFGTYAYAQFVSVNDARVEADNAFERMDKDSKFFVIDVEEVTTKNAADIVPATQAFIDRMKAHGVEKVGLYTGHSFYYDHKMNQVRADFLWIPRYPKEDKGQPTGLKPSMQADLWQYTQNGRVAGINGPVDLNQLIGKKTLDWFIGGQAQTATTNSPKQKEEIELYQPSNQAIVNSTAVVLSRLEKKDPGAISPTWRDKLQKGELTTSDAIGLIFVAIERGLIQGSNK